MNPVVDKLLVAPTQVGTRSLTSLLPVRTPQLTDTYLTVRRMYSLYLGCSFLVQERMHCFTEFKPIQVHLKLKSFPSY